MSSRFKGLLGSKRKSAVNIQSSNTATPLVGSPNGSTTTAATPPPPNASQTSLPPSMQNQQQLGRPPSYSYGNAAGRPQSPMPPGQPQQQMAHHPAPIDTRQSYMGQSTQQMGPPQPPGYGGAYGQAPQQGQGMQYMNAPHVAGRPAEVEGAGRSKAQLIVGIDFVSSLPTKTCKCPNDLGHHVFWRRICICDQHRGQGRYYHRMAWCW